MYPNPVDRDTNAPEKQEELRYALCSAFPIAQHQAAPAPHIALFTVLPALLVGFTI